MRRRSSAMIAAGILLITTAAFLTGYNVAEDRYAGASSGEAVSLITRIADDRKAVWEGADLEVIPDYLLNPGMEMPTVTKDGIDYVGVLEIPSQDLRLGIASKLSLSSLKEAPCRYAGSIYNNTCIIAGHNYRSHFGKLHSLQVGDAVTFTDVDGTVFPYEVSAIETVEGTDVEGMEAGEWDLTLFTCKLTRTQRLAIRCARTDQGGARS